MLRRLKKLLKSNVAIIIFTVAATGYIMTALTIINTTPHTVSKEDVLNAIQNNDQAFHNDRKHVQTNANLINDGIPNSNDAAIPQNAKHLPEPKNAQTPNNKQKHTDDNNGKSLDAETKLQESHDSGARNSNDGNIHDFFADIPKTKVDAGAIQNVDDIHRGPKEVIHPPKNDPAGNTQQHPNKVRNPAEPKNSGLSESTVKKIHHKVWECKPRISHLCRMKIKLTNELALKLDEVELDMKGNSLLPIDSMDSMVSSLFIDSFMDSMDFEKTCSYYKYKNYDGDQPGKNKYSDETSKNLRPTIPVDLGERVSSLVNLPVMPTKHVWATMAKMRQKIDGIYDVLILSAVTNSQFRTAMDMFEHLQKDIFPVLNDVNFKFILYDLGLSEEKREAVERKCRCILLDIPTNLPYHYRNDNSCKSWRTIIIATHFEQTEVVIWMDNSIRFSKPTAVQKLLQRTVTRGIQQKRTQILNNRQTVRSMFEFYGDSPCSHGDHIQQSDVSFGMYHNEPLIWHAVILPLLSCASRESCICPKVFNNGYNDCNETADLSDQRLLGTCHRREQSAISIILAHLFRELYNEVAVNMDKFQYVVDKDTSWYSLLQFDSMPLLLENYFITYFILATICMLPCCFRCGYVFETARQDLRTD